MNNTVYSVHYFWFIIIKIDTILELVMGLSDLFCVNTLATFDVSVCIEFSQPLAESSSSCVLFCTWQCLNRNCYTALFLSTHIEHRVSVMPSYMFDIIYKSILLLFEKMLVLCFGIEYKKWNLEHFCDWCNLNCATKLAKFKKKIKATQIYSIGKCNLLAILIEKSSQLKMNDYLLRKRFDRVNLIPISSLCMQILLCLQLLNHPQSFN